MMDISYIFSKDELYTLVYALQNVKTAQSETAEDKSAGEMNAGEKPIMPDFLQNAQLCDLARLAEKDMVKLYEDGQAEISPIIRMLIDAIAFPDNAENSKQGWVFKSNWITVKCETYPYKDNHYKLTPLNPTPSHQ